MEHAISVHVTAFVLLMIGLYSLRLPVLSYPLFFDRPRS